MFRSYQPSKLCEEGIVYILDFLKPKTAHSLRETEFVPGSPSKELALLFLGLPLEPPSDGIKLITNFVRYIECGHSVCR